VLRVIAATSLPVLTPSDDFTWSRAIVLSIIIPYSRAKPKVKGANGALQKAVRTPPMAEAKVAPNGRIERAPIAKKRAWKKMASLSIGVGMAVFERKIRMP